MIHMLVAWVLLWTLWRMATLHTQLVDGRPLIGLRYLLLFATVAALAHGYAVACYLFFRRGQWYGTLLREYLQRSRSARFLAGLTPGLFWTLALVLHELATPFEEALVDGPILLLAISGMALLFAFSKIAYAHSDHANEQVIKNSGEERTPQHRFRSTKRVTIMAVALITLAVLAVFRQALFDPDRVVFGLDLFRLHYDFEHFVREALYAGRLPLWNPYIFSGSPALAHPQYLVFYPPQILLRLLPLNLSLSWGIASHVWLAGVGMFLLGRYFRLDVWIATLCAFAYMLNTGLMLRVVAGHVWLLYALSWFPLAWLFLIQALRTGGKRPMVGATLTSALIILTGHPTLPIYLLLFLTLFSFYSAYRVWVDTHTWSSSLRIAARFGLIMAGAIGLSAVQLLPTVVMSGQVSLAGGYGANDADFLALSLSDLSALLIPHVYVNTAKQSLFWEMAPYLGISFLLLPPVALLAKPRHSLVSFLVGISVLAFFIAFGASLGLYSLLFSFIPPFRLARIPPRSLAILIPAIVVLAGLGLQTIQERQVDKASFARLTNVYLTASLLVMTITIGTLMVHANRVHGNSLILGVKSLPVLVASSLFLSVTFSSSCRLSWFHPMSLSRLIQLGTILPMGLMIGLFIIPAGTFQVSQLLLLAALLVANTLLLSFLYKHGPARLTVLLLFALLLLDLGSSSLRNITAQHPPEFYEAGRALLAHKAPRAFERILSFDNPNEYMLGHASHVDGYNSGILSGYETFLRTVTSNPSADSTSILDNNAQIDARALDFLGVRYFISDNLNSEAQFELLASGNEYHLYENPNPLPRAFVVHEVELAPTYEAASRLLMDEGFDYSKKAVIVDRNGMASSIPAESFVSIETYVPTSGDLTMSVQTTAPGILVMSEPYYSERRVWVDGQEVAVIRANIGFIGVEVMEGEHVVELRYVPSSLFAGTTITLITVLLGTVALLITYYRSRGRRPEAEPSLRV